MMKAVNEIAAKYRVEVGTFGHAGDGNLHPTFLCDKRNAEEFKRVEEAIDEMFDVAIKLQGTLSGEHGIGTAKAKWMEKETSRGTILFSQRLRQGSGSQGPAERHETCGHLTPPDPGRFRPATKPVLHNPRRRQRRSARRKGAKNVCLPQAISLVCSSQRLLMGGRSLGRPTFVQPGTALSGSVAQARRTRQVFVRTSSGGPQRPRSF